MAVLESVVPTSSGGHSDSIVACVQICRARSRQEPTGIGNLKRYRVRQGFVLRKREEALLAWVL